MGPSIIARNYAETLFTLAQRHGGDSTVDEYARAIDQVTEILDREPLVRNFLESPRVELEAKKRALEASFRGRVPDLFVRFLLLVVEKRRQAILRAIGQQYHTLVDASRGRVRAEITLAREPDEALRREIVSSLEKRTGRTVVPSFAVDQSLIGGIVIRIGGEILDGSLRRRAAGLRRRLLDARLPAATVGAEH